MAQPQPHEEEEVEAVHNLAPSTLRRISVLLSHSFTEEDCEQPLIHKNMIAACIWQTTSQQAAGDAEAKRLSRAACLDYASGNASSMQART